MALLGESKCDVDLKRSEDCNRNFAYIPATVDLPTPPLADATAMILSTPGIRRFSGRPRCIRGTLGGALLLGRPLPVSAMRNIKQIPLPRDSHARDNDTNKRSSSRVYVKQAAVVVLYS